MMQRELFNMVDAERHQNRWHNVEARLQIICLIKSFPKIGTIGPYAVCRAAAAGRR